MLSLREAHHPNNGSTFHGKLPKIGLLKNIRNTTIIFNMTMTYSKHSDIFFPYGKCREVQTNKSEMESEINFILENKSKFVGWHLSSCRSQSSR